MSASENAQAIARIINQQIHSRFAPVHFELHNDSAQHATASDASHFRLLVVSDKFANVSLVRRHQMIYSILADVMTRIHALAIQTYTTEEWSEHPVNEARNSPPCAKQSH